MTSERTGSQSGSASPATRYGSFPPRPEDLRKLLLPLGKGAPKRGRRMERYRREWAKSEERVLFASTSVDGRLRGEDVYDRDAETEVDSLDDPNRPASRGAATTQPGERAEWAQPHLDVKERLRRHSGGGGGAGAVKQRGVLKMELMGRHWGRSGLLRVFAGIYAVSTLLSIEANTIPTVEPYFLSFLGSHSSISSVAVVMSIAYAVGKAPMTKVLDVFGRAEGVALAAAIYSLGFLLTAFAQDVRVYIVARGLSALGGQGLQLALQLICADTTTLSNRGLLTSTISLPWVITTWLGPPLGAWFQSGGERGYRLAYGTFGVLLPLASALLIGTLWGEWRKVKTTYSRPEGSAPEPKQVEAQTETHEWTPSTWANSANDVWRDLDVVGLITLTTGCVLLLLPLTLAASHPEDWASLQIWSLVVSGAGFLIFFVHYEFNMSPLPMLPPRLLLNRTILAGSMLGFFHFSAQAIYESYFTSFLQVARGHSPRDASYISQSYIFAASVSAIVAGAGAKFSRRYKWIGILGVLIHLAGTLLMTRTRNLDSETWEVVLSQILGGIGGGLSTIAAQIGVQSVVGHQDVGMATAIFLTITQIGGAVGALIASCVWSALPGRLREYLPLESHDLIPEIMASLPFAISFPPQSIIRLAIDRAYVDTQQILNWLAVMALLPALASICAMKSTHLVRDDQGQGEKVVVLGRASFLHDSGLETDSETSSLLGDRTPDRHSTLAP